MMANTRKQVHLGGDLSRVVDETIEALASAEVFQRGGALVDVVRDATESRDRVVRPEGTPRVRLTPAPRVRELVLGSATFLATRRRGDKVALVETAPPQELITTLIARGQWAHIRSLRGVSSWPVLRGDGTVAAADGYDPATRLLITDCAQVSVNEAPTRDNALAALQDLLELVADFPFESEAGRAAWLAALLSPIARPAIDGPVPLTLLDANVQGAGKTLLADAIGVLVTGQPLPRRTAPDDPSEWRKAMLAIAIAADPIVLVDNVTRVLRSDALDAALTGTAFRDRVLGRNEELSLEFRTQFIVTANNATLSADLVRRSLYARLVAADECPERRTGFKHPDLLAHIKSRRPRLLRAALVVLRAYVLAGRPPVDLRPMGSFERWSAVVRAPLVWLGLPDPAATQDALRATAEPERDALRDVLTAWRGRYRDDAVTVARVLADLGDRDDHSPAAAALRHAVAVFCDVEAGKLPNARSLGNRLRRARERVVSGLVLAQAAGYDREGVRWRVCESGVSRDSLDKRTHTDCARFGGNGHAGESPESADSQPGLPLFTDDGDERAAIQAEGLSA